MSYSNDVASPEVEIAGEAAGSSFFADARNKYADLKAMLDSSKDSLKMEAMKRIINMIAKGKDASELFPAVVKNVASKNVEVKKLVYVYLMRYAEEQQDLALLSISTFQRALKDPNQLIRASALRVLSGIRVPIIVPIMMLAIKESMRDMSPYVRKVAAHAIPKLYSMDPDHRDELIEVIDHLLADKTTLVIGSAVYAFEEVCPERIDLIHKHYRKLCQLLVDVDEWGQVIIINMMTRYCRNQFGDPNEGEENLAKEEKFYSSASEASEAEEKSEPQEKPYVMDQDLRTLLRNAKSLLQSRNAAVVLAVAQLYYHVAPKNEVGIIAKSLIRLLRSHREVQSIVLSNIATISSKRRSMFEPFLKSFFVRSSDPTHIKLLKLEILTNLATQTNISVILREFQTYVQTHDKEFAAATIDAIGRCACNIKEVTDVCLSGLVNLMSNKNEVVVAQSVVVIKKLLQLQPSQHQDIIASMTKLIDSVKVPAARASILWLIGEYCQVVPLIAPDVLRKMAKSFIHEEGIVKLQILNLAVKLYLTNPEQVHLLVQYVFSLARYDQSYDLRDRARFLKNLILPSKPSRLTDNAKEVFLTTKPAPVIESTFKDRDQFQLGTLSHYLNQRCSNYRDLPEFPETPPDSTVRNVEGWGTPVVGTKNPTTKVPGAKSRAAEEKFYSDEEAEIDSSDEKDSSADEEETNEDEEDEDEEEDEEDDDIAGDDDEEDEDDEDEEKEDDSEDESDDEDEDSDDEKMNVQVHVPPKKEGPKEQPKPVAAMKATKETKEKPAKAKQSIDLLLDLDFDAPAVTPNAPMVPVGMSSVLAPSTNSQPPTATAVPVSSSWNTAPAQYVPQVTVPLLSRVAGNGLVMNYRFTRSPSLFSSKMCSLELMFLNDSDKPLGRVALGDKKLHHGMDMHGTIEIESLLPKQNISNVLGIDFADTTQPAAFEIVMEDRKYPLSITAPVGEQVQPIVIDAQQFKSLQNKLSGMNETAGKIKLSTNLSMDDTRSLAQKVYEAANVIQTTVSDDRTYNASRKNFTDQNMRSGFYALTTTFKQSNDRPEKEKSARIFEFLANAREVARLEQQRRRVIACERYNFTMIEVARQQPILPNSPLRLAESVSEANMMSDLIAEDIVNWAIAQPHAARPRNDYEKNMRRLVADMLDRHSNFLGATAQRLNELCDADLMAYLKSIADSMLSDNHRSWGRLVALFALVARTARQIHETDPKAEKTHLLINFLRNYTRENFDTWIQRQGGWEEFLRRFPAEVDYEPIIFKGLLATGVALSVMAGLIALR